MEQPAVQAMSIRVVASPRYHGAIVFFWIGEKFLPADRKIGLATPDIATHAIISVKLRYGKHKSSVAGTLSSHQSFESCQLKPLQNGL